MVNVYHVVAHFELLDFLQRQRHLAATCLVALQVVFVEAVKYLMVGEEACLQVIVDESLVQSFVNRDEYFRKNVLQSFLLLLAICQDVESVALSGIQLQRLRQQIEILVEQRLSLGVEGDGRGFQIPSNRPGIANPLQQMCEWRVVNEAEPGTFCLELFAADELAFEAQLFFNVLLLQCSSAAALGFRRFHTFANGLL